MELFSGLSGQVATFLNEKWEIENARVVPEPEDIKLSNHAKLFDAVVFYADLADSTLLVDKNSPEIVARLYKMFLNCAARLVRVNDGKIVSYDGDRVMGIYIGDRKEINAVTTALNLSYAVTAIINKAIGANLKYVAGIDSSGIFASRIGIHNDNDLVWIGRAANYAAKLSSINGDYRTYITDGIYRLLPERLKPADIWKRRAWTPYDGSPQIAIYGANAHISFK
jgi:class 3 adenylate cyclase